MRQRFINLHRAWGKNEGKFNLLIDPDVRVRSIEGNMADPQGNSTWIRTEHGEFRVTETVLQVIAVYAKAGIVFEIIE